MSESWDGITERRVQTIHCQQEILDRLTKIEVESTLIRQTLIKIEKALNGDGAPGLLIRHDRVEQIVKVCCWALGVVYIAMVSLLVRLWRP